MEKVTSSAKDSSGFHSVFLLFISEAPHTHRNGPLSLCGEAHQHIRFLFVVLWNGDWSGGRCARFSKKSWKTIAFVVIMQTHLMYGCQTIDIDDNSNRMMCARAARACVRLCVQVHVLIVFHFASLPVLTANVNQSNRIVHVHRNQFFITTSSLNGNASACQQTRSHMQWCEPGQNIGTRKEKNWVNAKLRLAHD